MLCDEDQSTPKASTLLAIRAGIRAKPKSLRAERPSAFSSFRFLSQVLGQAFIPARGVAFTGRRQSPTPKRTKSQATTEKTLAKSHYFKPEL